MIGQSHCHRIPVGFGIDLHDLDAELMAGALDTHGDFAAVGDKNPSDLASLARQLRLLSASR